MLTGGFPNITYASVHLQVIGVNKSSVPTTDNHLYRKGGQSTSAGCTLLY